MGPKVGKKWVRSAKWVKMHQNLLFTRFEPISGYSQKKTLLTQFKGGGNCFPRTKRGIRKRGIHVKVKFPQFEGIFYSSF